MEIKKLLNFIVITLSLLLAFDLSAKQQTGAELIKQLTEKEEQFEMLLKNDPILRKAFDYRRDELGAMRKSQLYVTSLADYRAFWGKSRRNPKSFELLKEVYNILGKIAEYEFGTEGKTAKYYFACFDNENDAKIALNKLKEQLPAMKVKINTLTKSIPDGILSSMKCLSKVNGKLYCINRLINKKASPKVQALYKDIVFFKRRVEAVKKAGTTDYVDSLIKKIKLTIDDIKQTKAQLQKDNPDSERYAKKYKSFSAVSSLIGKPNNRAVPQTLRRALVHEDPLLIRKNPEVVNGIRYIKNNCADQPDLLKIVSIFEKYNVDLVLKQRLATLEKQHPISVEDRERIVLHSTYSWFFELYWMFSRVYYKKIYEKIDKLKTYKKELDNLRPYITDKSKKQKVSDFIKKQVYPQLKLLPANSSDYLMLKSYFITQLFLDCMKSQKQKDVIKKVLQQFLVLRKLVVEHILRSRRVEMNYADFDSYWQQLNQLVVKMLAFKPERFQKLLKETDATTRNDATLSAELFLECFFGNKLSMMYRKGRP